MQELRPERLRQQGRGFLGEAGADAKALQQEGPGAKTGRKKASVAGEQGEG